MYLKQLIKNEKEYWEFVWPFIDWASDPNKSLWRAEDRPKLEPFFAAQNRGRDIEWTDEIKASFDFYQKCREEYGEKNTELRDAVSKCSISDLLDAFGYEYPEFDHDEDFSKDTPPKLDKDFDATFPFVVTGDIHCGWDRSGDFQILSVYWVSLKDFNDK